MSEVDLVQFATSMLLLTLVISLPPVGIAAVVGILVSIVQALTQIQEQTLSFAARMIAVVLVIYLGAAWYGSEIYNFALSIFNQIARMSANGPT